LKSCHVLDNYAKKKGICLTDFCWRILSKNRGSPFLFIYIYILYNHIFSLPCNISSLSLSRVLDHDPFNHRERHKSLFWRETAVHRPDSLENRCITILSSYRKCSSASRLPDRRHEMLLDMLLPEIFRRYLINISHLAGCPILRYIFPSIHRVVCRIHDRVTLNLTKLRSWKHNYIMNAIAVKLQEAQID